MARALFFLLLFSALIWAGTSAYSQNPFMSKKSPERISETPAPQHSFLLKITLWQQQLKQKMAALIREARTEERMGPLMVVLLIAFGYGALHAAGPGHGKAVAMSFMLSRNATLSGGLLFGILIALFHGFSGILCVLGLRYILQQSISGSLGTVSRITQMVSFSLITLLGLAIVFKNSHAFFAGNKIPDPGVGNPSKTHQKSFLPMILAVGLVPCPGVVMVLLFCLSMDAFMLGLLLAVVISLGMAATISFVIVAVVLGKDFSMKFFSEGRAVVIEQCTGLVSGVAITTLGVLFLLSTFDFQ